ncbi:MAG: hypothetical protein ACP5II_06300 [Infirmifilum sp.]|jgi:hypothetical protein|uniref:hypothetical protein n=2 Tax=Thermofilaceae TaxID=114378 RepID=UPI003C7232BE
MVQLPREFIEWNYFARRALVSQILEGASIDPYRLQLEFTRHNPVLCTAALQDNGTIEVNGKVIGVGYVLKKEFLAEASRKFEEHIKVADEALAAHPEREKEILEEYSRRGIKLLLDYIYLPRGMAEERVDFEKMASLELALRIPHSSKHTWRIVQRSRKACLVFYQPPAISFEVRCSISIHLDDDYHRFVNLVHDAFHYTPPEARENRPTYIFHVEEVFNNSPSRAGFGKKLT